ncbi:unnamed protein product [Tilletia caries]|nr:unnamed protein product [Tilletia caries]
MEASQQNIDALAGVFARSLEPAGRVDAEAALAQASAQPGYPQCLLALIQSSAAPSAPGTSAAAQSPPAAVRLAAAISLKNLCKTAWTAEDAAAAQDSETTIVVHESDKVAVRAQLLPLLFHLASSTGPAASTPGLGGVRSQLSEAVALVAAHDFPVAWPELVSSLAEQLKNSQDFGVLTTVLETSHSIFGRWRSAFRTNELYTEINLVLEQFATPFLEFLQKTDASLSDPNIPAGPIVTQLANAMRLNLIVFHDLSAQDLPPAFEDNMPSLSALFIKYLSFTRPDLASESDQELTPEQGEEDETQPGPLELIRIEDEFLFEEEPIDYIRLDMESNIDTDTRRRAASAFTRALMEQFESTITGVISTYISQYLASYAADPAANWRSKDTAICLLTSIASRSETTTQGVSSTNSLVNVVQFFSDHVFVDLQADSGSVAPILQADAIKYLYTFRNQLNKEQLLSVMPLFVKHLESPHYVVASYAALTIERVLVLKDKAANTMLFTADDVKPFAEAILLAAFRTIRSGSSPEKVAENDYMMKCAMRLIFTARSSIVPFYAPILDNLRAILVEIAKNPSNPKFSHYCFESVAALVRYAAADGNEGNLGAMEAQLFPPFTAILQGDVTEFVPYVFQLLAQMLELRANLGGNSVPESYQVLLPPLLTPALWESKGNVPALVRLLRAFIAQGSAGIVAGNQLQALLGIYQRLITSRVNDLFGFELITALCEHVPMTPTLEALLKLFLLPQDRSTSAEDDISGVDWDDAGAAGFQASFARLSASEPGAGRRPGGSEALATRWAGEDARVYMSRELGAAAKRDGRIRSLAQAANGELLGPFVQFMAQQGDSL